MNDFYWKTISSYNYSKKNNMKRLGRLKITCNVKVRITSRASNKYTPGMSKNRFCIGATAMSLYTQPEKPLTLRESFLELSFYLFFLAHFPSCLSTNSPLASEFVRQGASTSLKCITSSPSPSWKWLSTSSSYTYPRYFVFLYASLHYRRSSLLQQRLLLALTIFPQVRVVKPSNLNLSTA